MSQPTATFPELPTLESEIILLESESAPMPVLPSLILDQVLTGNGPAYWIDAGGHAQTTVLSELTPDPRVLDRIQIARAFTPYQHVTLLSTLDATAAETPGIIVCPAFDLLYRENDLPETTAQEFLLRGLAAVAGSRRTHECPLIITRTKDDTLSAPLEAAATRTVHCESTRFGPRFIGDDFETLVYPETNGWAQTTLAFWQRVLATRVQMSAENATKSAMEVTGDGAY